MEAQNDPRVVPDDEFLNLLQKAKQNDPEAVMKLIELYKGDIMRVSRYIHSPTEDAVSDIILEFLELIKKKEGE
ncbi:helix-turn-helix domain-containing protein [Paenibacillus sp. M1]|uniref:Helix-turn-helix domain-containing protein n=1 Tax=Paenibacillus haidiansis TaxID=1574488 RepID=A0ABU7VW17_9BACL